MPTRMLKESICYSDDLDKLTAFAETVFYRLLVRVDDYGRIDARPGFLKSTLFVTKNGVSEKNVSEAVAQMASLGLVRLYEVDRKPFLCLPKWHLHQRIRESKEKYPPPPESNDFETLTDIRDNSPQFAATRGNSPPESNPIQSESESESNIGTSNEVPRDRQSRITAAADFVPFQKILELYNVKCTRLRKIKFIGGSRQTAVAARYKSNGMDAFETLFEAANASDFLCGTNEKNWSADFDWLMKATNMAKVLEGKYDNHTSPQARAPARARPLTWAQRQLAEIAAEEAAENAKKQAVN